MRTEKTLLRTIIEHETGQIVTVVRVRLFNDDNTIEREWTQDTADGLTFDVENRPEIVAALAFVETTVAPVVAAKLGLAEISVPDMVAVVDQKIADKEAADAKAAEEAEAEEAKLAAEAAVVEEPE